VMQDMADHVANSQFVELEGAGHLTPIEAGEQFTAAVLAFLTAS
jgi:pimeloyl-ACP methyl ester carboxylesterase